jgi:hypothetical protein
MHSAHPVPRPSGSFAVQIGNPADLSNPIYLMSRVRIPLSCDFAESSRDVMRRQLGSGGESGIRTRETV